MSELHRKVLIPFMLLLFFPVNNIISSAQKARWRPEQVLGNPGLAFDSGKVRVEVKYRLRREQEVGFKAGSYDARFPLVIDLVQTWNTFLGSSTGFCSGRNIAVDTSGNVYVTGESGATWGSPVRPFVGSCDAFIAKIDLGIFPPSQFSLQRLVNNFIFYKEYINRLTWTANPMNTRNIVRYKIYRRVAADSASAFDLLVEFAANVFSYDDRGLKKGIAYTYRITAVDEDGQESGWAEIGN